MAQKLKTKLFFPFARAVRALGVKDLLEKIERALKESGGELTTEAGLRIFGELVERLPDAEDQVLDFLALFLEKSREEVDEMDLVEETIPAVKAVFQDVKFPDFLRSALEGSQRNSTTSS